MPNYFKSKAEQLHAEAYASFLLIEVACANSINGGMISDKLCRVYQNAQSRCARRFSLMVKGK